MPALALIVVGTFAGHAIAGPNGILAWGGYHRALQERQAELAQLERSRRSCGTVRDLLDPRKADPDMADELVRKDLGPGAPRRGDRPARLVAASCRLRHRLL